MDSFNNYSNNGTPANFDFGTQMPIPFSDAVYRSIYLNVSGTASLTAKAGPMDDTKTALAKSMIISKLGQALSGLNGMSYKDLPSKSGEISRFIAEGIADTFDVLSLQFLSFEPDQMSLKKIEKQDEMKRMADPEYAAKKMEEARARAEAMMAKAKAEGRPLVDPRIGANASMPVNYTPPKTEEEHLAMAKALQAAATGAAVSGFCTNCGFPLTGGRFCTNCGHPVGQA